jgi:rhodanese-related sulfurtransferase
MTTLWTFSHFQHDMATFRKKPVDIVIDVRSRLEFWLGHLPNAKCLPVQSIADAIADQKDVTKRSRILLYCASGARSASAAATLRALGYTHVTDGGAMSSAAAEYVA